MYGKRGPLDWLRTAELKIARLQVPTQVKGPSGATSDREPEEVDGAPNGTSEGSDLAVSLSRLAEMHRDGTLSDEEFAASKRKLLTGDASGWALNTGASASRGRDRDVVREAKNTNRYLMSIALGIAAIVLYLMAHQYQ